MGRKSRGEEGAGRLRLLAGAGRASRARGKAARGGGQGGPVGQPTTCRGLGPCANDRGSCAKEAGPHRAGRPAGRPPSPRAAAAIGRGCPGGTKGRGRHRQGKEGREREPLHGLEKEETMKS
jgi:hypothetical protein